MLPLPEDGSPVEGVPQPQVSNPLYVNGMAAKRSGAASPSKISVSMAEGSAADSLLRFRGKIGRCDGDILIDSGASFNFISEEFVMKNRMKTTLIDGPRVQVADGTIYHCTAILPKTHVKIGPYRSKVSYYVLPMRGNEAILGTPWLTTANPQIDWQTKTITIQDNGHEIRLQPESPRSTQPEDGLTTLTALQANKEIRRGAMPA